jgi:hypothetical protein
VLKIRAVLFLCSRIAKVDPVLGRKKEQALEPTSFIFAHTGDIQCKMTHYNLVKRIDPSLTLRDVDIVWISRIKYIPKRQIFGGVLRNFKDCNRVSVKKSLSYYSHTYAIF